MDRDESLAADRGAEVDTDVIEDYEKLVQKALGRLDWCKGTKDRGRFEDRCSDAQRFWLGDQWSGIKSYGIQGRSSESKRLHPNPVDNYFKAHIEGLVGDMTDRPVDIQLKPREPGDEESASKMQEVVQYIWYRNNGDRMLEFAVRRGCLYGPLVAKVYWEPDIVGSPGNPFVGDVRFFTFVPTQLFVDPRVKATEAGVIQQAEFLIYATRRSLEYVRRNYPEKGHLVQPDSYASYVDTLSGVSQDYSIDEDSSVLLIEYWYKGDPVAPDFPKIERRLSEPKGIKKASGVHVAIIAGGVLLKHITYASSYYPFVMEWIYPSDESVYGYGDGYDILLPQLIINKLNEIALEGAALASKGNWITEEGNIRNIKNFQRYATMGGAVLPVSDVARTRRELGGVVPGTLFMHYRQEQQAMEAVSGRFDVAQGRAPRNVRAASGLALLLQQAGGRVRQRARAAASFVEQITHMIVDLVLKYYTEERLIRIVGKDGSISWDKRSAADFLKKKVYVDPVTGETVEEEYTPEFDVIVTTGTETPASKAYYTDLAVQLFQMGVIDEVALMETLQFPKWREVLARKAAVQAQVQAQAQAQAQAMQVQQSAQQQVGGPVPPEVEAMRGGAELQRNPMQAAYGGAPGIGGDEITRLVEALRSVER